jgi:hypothetical protein
MIRQDLLSDENERDYNKLYNNESYTLKCLHTKDAIEREANQSPIFLRKNIFECIPEEEA